MYGSSTTYVKIPPDLNKEMRKEIRMDIHKNIILISKTLCFLRNSNILENKFFFTHQIFVFDKIVFKCIDNVSCYSDIMKIKLVLI